MGQVWILATQACEKEKPRGNRKIHGMVTEGVTGKGVFYLAQLSGDKGIQAPEINRNKYEVPKYLSESG